MSFPFWTVVTVLTLPTLIGWNKSKAILLHLFVIWILYGFKPVDPDHPSQAPDEPAPYDPNFAMRSSGALHNRFRRHPVAEPLTLDDYNRQVERRANRQVERRAQPSLPVPQPGAAESPLGLLRKITPFTTLIS